MKKYIFLLLFFGIHSIKTMVAQAIVNENYASDSSLQNIYSKKHTMNFFVISKRKKGKFDIATRYNIFRTKIKSVMHHKDFASIVAKNTLEMQRKIDCKLKKRNSAIGTIWFDSHGMYKKGYSLFFIGTDEINFRSINNSSISTPLKNLSNHATVNSRFIIGSCYGGATFKRLINNYKDSSLMHGDSLMISLGNFFNNGIVYGAESWVMSRPGLFLYRLSVYGNPGRKIFHDKYYKPAWDRIGKWNKYNVNNSLFEPANAITLNANGKLIEFKQPYSLKKKYRRNIQTIVANLKPNLLKIN